MIGDSLCKLIQSFFPPMICQLNGCPHFFSCDQAALQMVFSVCPSVCLSHLFTPQPKLGSRGIVVACRAGGLAGGRALPHTVTALPGAVLIGSRSNLVGTNLGAGSRMSSFMGDVAR